MREISVTIPCATTWPTSEELSARNAAMKEVDAAAIGKCTGAGGGMGEMDFCYRVDDEFAARTAIEQAMKKHFPNTPYRIKASDA
jgi:hypothetical protein